MKKTIGTDPNGITRSEKHILKTLTYGPIADKFLPAHHLAAYTSPRVIQWDKLEKILDSLQSKNLIETQNRKGAYGPWYKISTTGCDLVDAC